VLPGGEISAADTLRRAGSRYGDGRPLGYDAGVQLKVAVVRIRGIKHRAVPTGRLDPLSGKNIYSTLCGCNREPADEIDDDVVDVDCMTCLVRGAR
jgi:hypothetical protein